MNKNLQNFVNHDELIIFAKNNGKIDINTKQERKLE